MQNKKAKKLRKALRKLLKAIGYIPDIGLPSTITRESGTASFRPNLAERLPQWAASQCPSDKIYKELRGRVIRRMLEQRELKDEYAGVDSTPQLAITTDWRRYPSSLLHRAALRAGIFSGSYREYRRNLHSPTPESAGLLEKSVQALESGILLAHPPSPAPTGSAPISTVSRLFASPAILPQGGEPAPTHPFQPAIDHLTAQVAQEAKDPRQEDSPSPACSEAAGPSPMPEVPISHPPMISAASPCPHCGQPIPALQEPLFEDIWADLPPVTSSSSPADQ